MEENSNNTSLFRSVLNSVGNLSRLSRSVLGRNISSITSTRDENRSRNIAAELGVSKNIDFLNITHNQRCITINFRSNKFDFLNDIITKEMIFITETAKHGSIYKTPDRKTTVTMYKSTSCMHVQGSNYWLWTKEFVKSIKSKLEDRSQNSALEDSCAYNPPQMTSTPKRNDQETSTRNHSCRHASEFDSSMSDSLLVLVDEIALLRNRINQLELERTNCRTTCDSSSQTEPTNVNDACTKIDARHFPSIEKECQTTSAVTDTVTEAAGTNTVNDTVITDAATEAVGTGIATEKIDSSAVTYADMCAKPSKIDQQNIKKKLTTTNANKTEKHLPSPTNPRMNSRNWTPRTNKATKSFLNHGNKQNTSSWTKVQNRETTTMIIGSSLLKYIKTRGLAKGVKVRTMRGAKTYDVRAAIEKTNLSGVKNVILQVGGNDASENRDPEAIENDLVETVRAIHRNSPETTELLSRKCHPEKVLTSVMLTTSFTTCVQCAELQSYRLQSIFTP